jgi:predicted transcriptional regulator
MKRNVIAYEEDTPIRIIYEFLCRVTIRGIVVTKDGCPTGTITRESILRWFRDTIAERQLAACAASE